MSKYVRKCAVFGCPKDFEISQCDVNLRRVIQVWHNKHYYNTNIARSLYKVAPGGLCSGTYIYIVGNNPEQKIIKRTGQEGSFVGLAIDFEDDFPQELVAQFFTDVFDTLCKYGMLISVGKNKQWNISGLTKQSGFDVQRLFDFVIGEVYTKFVKNHQDFFIKRDNVLIDKGRYKDICDMQQLVLKIILCSGRYRR